MKILHCITHLADSGGAEKLLEDLLPSLQAGRNEVACLAFQGGESKNRTILEQNGIKVFELSKNSLFFYNPIRILQIIPFLRKYDIIHTHLTAPQLFVAIANLFCRARLITTEHNTDNRRRHIALLKPLDRWLYGQYEKVICCSEQTRVNLCKYLPNLQSKAITINNGVRLSKFAISNSKEKVLTPEDAVKIVMVAWFRPQKDHGALIKAVTLLPEQFHAYFVGGGETKAANEQLAKDLNVDDRVHFLGQRTDVPKILHDSDYIVLSSHYEGLSLSSIEGMCAGKPFIASDVDGLRDVVGGAGVLFAEGDAEGLAKSIMELHNNKTLYKEVAEKCHERAMNYDMSIMASNYLKEYEQLMNK